MEARGRVHGPPYPPFASVCVALTSASDDIAVDCVIAARRNFHNARTKDSRACVFGTAFSPSAWSSVETTHPSCPVGVVEFYGELADGDKATPDGRSHGPVSGWA